MGIQNIDSEQLSGWAAFINNLTPKKIILTIALAIGLVFAYSLYEQKATLPQLLTTNPTLLYAIVALGALATVGGMFNSIQNRIDKKQQEVMSEVRERVSDQEENHKMNMERLERNISVLEVRERECNDRHLALVIQLAKKGFFKDEA